MRTRLALLCVFLCMSPVRDGVAQPAFSSGSTGADGALVYYSPPPSRQFQTLVYDSRRHVVVMFGGSTSDTWEWNGARWSRVTPETSPPARRSPAMSFDEQRGVVVLFGGQSRSDTWEFDGVSWTQRTSATAPPPGTHVMTYHAARQRSLLLTQLAGSPIPTNQVWEWDGNAWSPLGSAPATRAQIGLAYDSLRNVAVYYGRFPGSGVTAELSASGSWTTLQTAQSPPSTFGFQMAFDPTRRETILCVAEDGSFAANQTWAWNGTAWTLKSRSPQPSCEAGQSLATDTARQRLLLFGNDAFDDDDQRNETWFWNGTTWASPTSGIFDMNTHPDGVWNFTDIDIPQGVTVRFVSNAANTPVVWLASGNVQIDGTVSLDGEHGGSYLFGNLPPQAKGGPGAFGGGLGGRPLSASVTRAGLPGGGLGGGRPGINAGENGGAGGHATAGAAPRGGAANGNRRLQPLRGGSGGGGGASTATSYGGNGGGGGGALIIASSGSIQLDGLIHADGGSGGEGGLGASLGGKGSGGAIRLIANRVTGSGRISVEGGGAGRVRIEASSVGGNFAGSRYVTALPLEVGEVSGASIRIVSIDGQRVTNPPGGRIDAPDVTFQRSGPVQIVMATSGVPTGAVLRVRVNAAGTASETLSSPVDVNGNAVATAAATAGVGTIEVFADYFRND